MTPDAPARVLAIRDPEVLQALAHPTRVEMLEVLREPGSAAAVGRRIGQPRQRVNHHLKALEEAGLVDRVGTRQRGNFTETLYRATACSYVVSPAVSWSGPQRPEALRSQHALETLVAEGERLQLAAAGLLDRAAFEGEEVASACVTAELGFADEAQRAAFLNEYLEVVKDLIERHGRSTRPSTDAPATEGPGSETYRVLLAVHPKEEGSVQ